MGDHVLVYVKWEVIQKWKKEGKANGELQGKEWRPPLPYVYGSGNTTFKKYVKGEAKVWVMSCPEYGTYRLPPTLIARLAIQEAVPRDGGKLGHPDSRIPKWFPEKWSWVAIADAGSSVYLPVNNAFVALNSAHSERMDGHKSRILDLEHLDGPAGPYTHVPRYLRFPKRLSAESVPPLVDHAKGVEQKQTVFVSYCRRDEPREFTGQLVEALIGEKFSPWLDMKSVPAKVASGEVRLKPGVLDRVLSDGIRQAHKFVAVVGPEFLRSTWAREEMKMAEERRRGDPGFSCLQVSVQGCKIPLEGISIIPVDTAQDTARRIRGLFEGGHPFPS